MEAEKSSDCRNETDPLHETDSHDEKGNSKLRSEEGALAPKITLSLPTKGENEVMTQEGHLARGMVKLFALQQDFNFREKRLVNEEQEERERRNEKLLDEKVRLTNEKVMLAAEKEELARVATRLRVRQISFNHEQRLQEEGVDGETRRTQGRARC